MEKQDINTLKKQIGHVAKWRLRNWKEKKTISVHGKLDNVTDSYFVIDGKFYPFTVWIISGAEYR